MHLAVAGDQDGLLACSALPRLSAQWFLACTQGLGAKHSCVCVTQLARMKFSSPYTHSALDLTYMVAHELGVLLSTMTSTFCTNSWTADRGTLCSNNGTQESGVHPSQA